MQRFVWLLLFSLVISSCSGKNPYLEASLKPAELQGKDKEWFEKNWGTPDGKASRFFGGETWTYHRIAGGNVREATLQFLSQSMSDYPQVLTKTKNFPTIPIQAANQLIARNLPDFSSTTAISYSF